MGTSTVTITLSLRWCSHETCNTRKFCAVFLHRVDVQSGNSSARSVTRSDHVRVHNRIEDSVSLSERVVQREMHFYVSKTTIFDPVCRVVPSLVS